MLYIPASLVLFSIGVLAELNIINQQVKRIVYLNSPILREEYSIVASLKNPKGEPVHNYLVSIPPKLAPDIAHISAVWESSKGGSTATANKPLTIHEVTAQIPSEECPMGSRCYLINLESPLTETNPKVSFGLGISYLNRYVSAPSTLKQDSPLQMKLELSPYFYTPFPTVQQKMQIFTIREFQIVNINCPKPRNLSPTPAPSSMVQGLTQYSCGVYENIPAFYEDFGGLKAIVKVTRVPFIQMKKMDRIIKVDLSREKLYVTEDYEIYHLGHGLEGDVFSKTSFISNMSKGTFNTPIQAIIPLSIPIKAENVEIRDELGLITNPLRRRPSPLSPTSHLLEIQPRNPLSGGWSLYWRISYSLPWDDGNKDSFVRNMKNGAKSMILREFDFTNDVGIENFSTTVVLPIDAKILGSQTFSTPDERFITALDYTIRPTPFRLGSLQYHKLEMKNLVREHSGNLMIMFTYPWYTSYKQSISRFLLIIAAIIIGTILSKLNLSLKNKDNDAWINNLARLFRDRRGIVNSIFKVRNDRERTEGLVVELMEISTTITSITMRLADSKLMNQASAALKRLYEEQLGKIKSILVEENPSLMSKLNKDAADLDERVLQYEAQFLSVHDN